MIEAARDHDVVVVEGQGALHHPGYSGVSLALMHGACPEALILCHWAGRTRLRVADDSEVPMPSLATVRDAAEQAAAWVHESVTVAVALNTLDMNDAAARVECEAVARELGLPVTDPVRFGAEPLAGAVVAAWERRRQRRADRPPLAAALTRVTNSSPERETS